MKTKTFFPINNYYKLCDQLNVDSKGCYSFLRNLILLNFEFKIRTTLVINAIYNVTMQTFTTHLEKSDLSKYDLSKLKDSIFEKVLELVFLEEKFDRNNMRHSGYMEFSKTNFAQYVSQMLGIRNNSELSMQLCAGNLEAGSEKKDFKLLDLNTFWLVLIKYLNYKCKSFEDIVLSKLRFYKPEIVFKFKTFDIFDIKIDEYYSTLQNVKNNLLRCLNDTKPEKFDIEVGKSEVFFENLYKTSLVIGEISLEDLVKDGNNKSKLICSLKSTNKNSKTEIEYLNYSVVATNELHTNNIFKSESKYFEELINTALSQKDMLVVMLTNLSPSIANFLFYKTWEYRGKVVGIHSDFGRLSFINSSLIPNNYHCSTDDIIEIILNCTSLFERVIDETIY